MSDSDFVEPSVWKIEAQTITPDTFKPFGQVIFASNDGKAFDEDDAQLNLDNGTPRLYIMRLHQKERTFSTITRHQNCTQCLGALEGKPWLIAVAPPGDAARPQPSDIQAFNVPGNCFIKLDTGTWHAGPYFDHDVVDFYSLELSDTNITDHDTCDLKESYGLIFEIT